MESSTVSLDTQKDLSKHKHDKECKVDECDYLKGRISFRDCACGGVLHAIDPNWDDYSFGHAGGYVYFTMMCDLCLTISETMG